MRSVCLRTKSLSKKYSKNDKECPTVLFGQNTIDNPFGRSFNNYDLGQHVKDATDIFFKGTFTTPLWYNAHMCAIDSCFNNSCDSNSLF